MGFLKKKKSHESDDDDLKNDSPKVKKAKDKSIKPSSPKRTSGKAFIRFVFWMFVLFIIFKGVVSFTQGTRVIEKVTNMGSSEPAITDGIKGFASDFATEYFTWSINDVNNRTERLKKFISGIDADAGLKPYEVKGTSHVQSVEVYDTSQINEASFEITLNVRREVDLDSASESVATKDKKGKVIKQTYIVVPVSATPKGFVIDNYPRFVANQQKGESVPSEQGVFISDTEQIERASELANSFLSSYFEGNVSQIKYFYDDIKNAPSQLTASEFEMNKVENVSVYQMKGTETLPSYLRIEASVLVKNDIGEIFTNLWILNVIEKDNRMYVISIGDQNDRQDKQTTVNEIFEEDTTNGTSTSDPTTSTE
ncbi:MULTISPECIES: conjugal transfer protein [Paenibacillus]|uniref:conjugal transfer protein n=1 Tax=Paenibacillus TaxID=44249 RepID=UPI000428F13C|nr:MULTISPECIES: conjugal transfer protein [Paenibacillus]KGP78096.1 hypothetical protein P364_0130020 [Paenibacillus sp. MAEPY2]KGP89382.1 hypothetical protein P363_0101630 [Paenibacillus sp. MAEPY1]OZQ71065.1 hypothetical protein CA599_11055 [Paenibacillus taichungensis]